MNIKAGGTILP